MKTWFRRIALVVVALVVIGAGLLIWANEGRPTGAVQDAVADALAHKMIKSVDAEAWSRTGAVSWTYADRYTHLWDRKRHLVRVRRDGWEVLLDIANKTGVATQDDILLTGDAHGEALEQAYAAWANDSFWLTAMNKPFDGGTTRSRVTLDDGSDGLFIEYSTGGVTPGDAYLWHLDKNGRPVSWQMWVSIIPIGGASATWEEWKQLKTGAWVSTHHKLGPLDIRVTDLDGAATLAELLPGPDPFASLMAAPASQPAVLE